jgi:hypothetical protein
MEMQVDERKEIEVRRLEERKARRKLLFIHFKENLLSLLRRARHGLRQEKSILVETML